MVHLAKVDRWVPAVFGGAAAVVFAMGTAFLVVGLTTDHLPLPTAVGIAAVDAVVVAILCVVLWGCYRIRYEITPPNLEICCGPIRIRVPLDSITEVFPTRNPTSAMAPSLERLQIHYRAKAGTKGMALVSPTEKSAFVSDLASVAPQLQNAGDERLRLKSEAAV